MLLTGIGNSWYLAIVAIKSMISYITEDTSWILWMFIPKSGAQNLPCTEVPPFQRCEFNLQKMNGCIWTTKH